VGWDSLGTMLDDGLDSLGGTKSGSFTIKLFWPQMGNWAFDNFWIVT
jgi:hypothetical protein